MNILAIIIGAIIGDLLPVSLIVLLIRLIFKRKISKGWCILVFILSVFCSWFIGYTFVSPDVKLGFLDYAIHFAVISIFLYDKNIISIFDTEKEIKSKSK